MKDGNSMDAITKWMYNNPEALNMGLGLMKGIEEDRRNKALSGAEIAKTQYGYLTGAGTGNIDNLSMNNIGKRTQQGAMAGMIQRRDNTLSEKLLAALAAKKGTTPSAAPNTRKPASSPEIESEYGYDGGSSMEHSPIEQLLNGNLKQQTNAPYQSVNPALQSGSMEDRINNLRQSKFYTPQR